MTDVDTVMKTLMDANVGNVVESNSSCCVWTVRTVIWTTIDEVKLYHVQNVVKNWFKIN